ncbi:hypothetical protein BHE74_00015193, partial [Ensete ventricosum]
CISGSASASFSPMLTDKYDLEQRNLQLEKQMDYLQSSVPVKPTRSRTVESNQMPPPSPPPPSNPTVLCSFALPTVGAPLRERDQGVRRGKARRAFCTRSPPSSRLLAQAWPQGMPFPLLLASFCCRRFVLFFGLLAQRVASLWSARHWKGITLFPQPN